MSVKPVKKSLLTGIILSAAIGSSLLSSTVFAQENMVLPEPAQMPGSDGQGFQGRESLHRMRFTVQADGSVTDAEHLGGFNSNPFFADMLTETVSGWTFTPGTVDGQPVPFHNQEFIISQRVDPALFSSPTAQEAFDDVNNFIQSGSDGRALRRLERVMDTNMMTVFDYAFAHELQSTILLSQEDYFGALEASKIATMSRTNAAGEVEYFMPDEFLEQALRKRFLLAATVGQNAEALRAFELLDARFDVPANDAIRKNADAVREIVDAPQLSSRAKIIDSSWSYVPRHRIFAVSDVNGRIRDIKVYCDRREVLELEFEENVDWTLPEALGNCTLLFEGRDNTEFTLYEFAE